MKKNDKLVVVLGVIILVLASIGVFYWAPVSIEQEEADADDFKHVTGSFKKVPNAIVVADTDPFYPLIATPIACHYDSNGEQMVIPLLVKNMDDPSSGVLRIKDQVGYLGVIVIDGNSDAKATSIDMAETYWDTSEAALII